MIRRVIAVVVVAALAYAGWHIGVAWSRYRTFQDGVREVALFSEGKTDEALKSKVMALASQHDVPLQADAITIERRGGEVTIAAHYTAIVEVLPGYTRPIDFTVK